MPGKLDQSLDDIVKTHRQTRARPVRRVGKPGKTVAPAGGIAKKTAVKAAKATKAAAAGKATNPIVPVAGRGTSKIVVSGLPADVSEQQIKEYFAKTIGMVRRATLTYGPTGQSRGIATIIFAEPGSAVDAAQQLNGVKVDNKPMKIEVILAASQAPVPVPAKTLSDRIAQPKTATKAGARSATKGQAKATAAATGKGRARNANPKKGRNAGRGKPKTQEELDAEMTDYFVQDGGSAAPAQANGAANGAGQATANGGDTGMEDEIM